MVSFTSPTLYPLDRDMSKPWFVRFEITDEATGITKRPQFRGSINYYKTEKDRLKEGEALARYWTDRLKAGWTPFQKNSRSDPNMPIRDALDYALSKVTGAKATKRGYAGTIDAFKEAAAKLGIAKLAISRLTRALVLDMLDHLTEEKEWSNHARNKHLDYLGAVLGKLEQRGMIEYNPAGKIPSLPVPESDMYDRLTLAERRMIHDRFQGTPFYAFLMVIYHSGIRPKEALALRVADIVLPLDLIKIVPDLDEENSKTLSIRRVAINKHLREVLEGMNLRDVPGSWYVFGSTYPAGKGNKAWWIGANHPDFWKPSPNRIKRDTATKFWKRTVMAPGPQGLGIAKHLYALKHTGAGARIAAGVAPEALKEQFGHESLAMTRRYAPEIEEVGRRQIIERSPGFLES